MASSSFISAQLRQFSPKARQQRQHRQQAGVHVRRGGSAATSGVQLRRGFYQLPQQELVQRRVPLKQIRCRQSGLALHTPANE